MCSHQVGIQFLCPQLPTAGSSTWAQLYLTMLFIQRPCYQQGLCQDPAGNHNTRRLPDHCKETPTEVVWMCLLFIRSSQTHLTRQQSKGEEENADRGRGGNATSGNGQVWSLASPRGQWRTGKNEENWLQNHMWCPNDPRG